MRETAERRDRLARQLADVDREVGRHRRADRRPGRSRRKTHRRRAGDGCASSVPKRMPSPRKRRSPRRASAKQRCARRCRKPRPNWRASRPRRARWRRSSTPRPAGFSRRCWSRSRSSAALRPRSAQHSAKISTPRSIAARRRIGAIRRPEPATRHCPRASVRLSTSCARRVSWRGGCAQIGIVDAADGAPAADAAEARPAAGQPRRRAVALGRVYRERRRADAGRAAPGAEEPAGRTRRRGGRRDAEGARRPKQALAAAEAAVRAGERRPSGRRVRPGATRSMRVGEARDALGAGREGGRRIVEPARGS